MRTVLSMLPHRIRIWTGAVVCALSQAACAHPVVVQPGVAIQVRPAMPVPAPVYGPLHGPFNGPFNGHVHGHIHGAYGWPPVVVAPPVVWVPPQRLLVPEPVPRPWGHGHRHGHARAPQRGHHHGW
jgi:hypothetical protein